MTTATYSAGTAYLTVVPSFRGVEQAFREQVRDMARAADRDLAAGMAQGLREAQRQARGTGARAGQDFAGAYAREARRTLDAAWRALPEPQPGVDMRRWDRALATIRSEMRELSEQRIGVDIDRATFDRAIDDFRRRLETLRDTAVGQNREIGFFNADQAATSLAEFQRFADDLSRRAGEAGDQAGSAFNQRMARVLRDGLAQLPPMRITADSSDAERQLAALRDRMVALQSRRIGVNIDAAEAFAELRAIAAELQRLDRTNVRVDIRTNAHEAAAGMTQFIKQAEQAGQATQSIGTRANFSMSRLQYLIALGASLGTAIVPAAAAAAGAIGLIGTAGISAVAGIGVLGLGLSGIGEAVQALNGYAQEQAKSANSAEAANEQVAASTDRLRMAQLALANTRRNVAEAAADAARRVEDAERAVGDARRQAAIDTQEAARTVRDARRAAVEAEQDVARARRQAALDLAEANRQVRDAQEAVTDAEQDAKEARLSLNEAIQEAIDNMAELDISLKRNDLEQQKATTAQMKALEELNALKMNPRATEVQIRQAQDAYDEQTQRLLELQQKEKELARDKAKYDKEGVEGDKAVIDARKRIAEADERVAKAREKLAREQEQRREVEIRSQERIQDAQERAARAQEQVSRALMQQRETELRAQRRIADAERSLSDARRDQARQRLDGEYQIAQASDAVTQAQRAQAKAWEKTGGAGSAALDKLNQKMGELSPAGQRFARFIFGLKDEVLGLRAAAAEPLLPQLETAITMLLKYLPAVERFVGKVAQTMGELAIKSVEALDNPVWQRFFRFVDQNAVPTLNMLYEVGQNTAQGLISLFLALTPFNDEIGAGLIEMSRDFAAWAERLERSQGYQDFLDYVRENGPKVVELLGELGELLIDLVKAAAPVGAFVLTVLTGLIDLLNNIPTGPLTALVATMALVALGFTTLGAVMRVVKLRQQLTDIFGSRTAAMVQQYAIETGRATDQTSRFGRATATVTGIAAAARDRVGGLAGQVGGLRERLSTATNGLGPLSRGMDNVRSSALQAGAALNGPGGVAAGAQAAQQRIAGLASTAAGAGRGGLDQARTSMLGVAAAANGPGGMAAGLTEAGRQVGGLAQQAGTAATAIGGRLRAGLTSVVNFLGPWNLAMAGAVAAIGTLAAASADYNGKIQTLATTLDQLGSQYRDLQQAGKLGTNEATNLLSEIAKSNPEMRQAVTNLDSIGISIGNISRAAAGSLPDVQQVLDALDAEIDETEKKWKDQANFLLTVWSDDAQATSDRLAQLRQLREAVKQHAEATRSAEQVQGLFNAQSERSVAMGKIVQNNVGATTGELSQMAMAWDRNQIQINELNATLGNFGEDAASAARRADDLTAAIKRQYGASIDANEAAERWSATLVDLSDSVAANGRSLDINSRAGLANRDALQRAAQASREMFIEEVRMGGELPKVTAKHNDRINRLREEANRLGLTKTETDKLIKTYGEIDPSITTKYTTQNFDKVFEQAKKLQFAQIMLELGITDPKEAQGIWNRHNAISTGNYPVGSGGPRKATGGQIVGPGTATSDDVLIWASNDEHMLTAAEVKAAGGHEAIYAWRRQLMAKRRLPGAEELPAHATGGPIIPRPRRVTEMPVLPSGYEIPRFQGGGHIYAPYIMQLGGTKLPTMAQALAAVEDGGTGTLGTGGGGKGWRWQMQVLRKKFPGLALYSGYRPGSVTSSGNRSWHGIDGGRAVDIPPRQPVFDFIHNSYGKGTKELIWGGDPNRNIQRGKHHRYSDSLLRAHGPYQGKPGPSPHIHWAFDEGGQLMPGWNIVPNFTGQPEPVLTNNQWKTIETFVSQGMAAGGRQVHHHYEFASSVLDEARVRAIQQRDDALNRIDRAY